VFRVIADHSHDGINFCELRTVQGNGNHPMVKRRLVYCNERYVEMSGFSREQLMAADDLNALVISRLSLEEREENTRLLQAGQPYSGVSSWKRPDGRENYHDWVAVPRQFHGRACVFGIDRDVTQRHLLGQALQKAHDGLATRVRERTAELARANEALRVQAAERQRAQEVLLRTQKLKAIEQLAAGIVHEFNNLLCVINGRAELILKSVPPSDPLRDAVTPILSAGERLTRIANQVLAFSRRQAIHPEALDLNEIVADIAMLVETLLGKNVKLTTVLAPDLPRVFADLSLVRQALMELVTNALDAMPNGGTLTIATAKPSPGKQRRRAPAPVLLTVTDTGGGMDKNVKAHLFEPFFTTKESAAGMGLASVYGFIKQTGGEIGVTSGPGKGTSFTIRLPAAKEGTAWPPPHQKLPIPKGTETILLVDDEEEVRAVVSEMLGGLGYKVISAASGPEALCACEERQDAPHLLISDVIMPHMDGTELATRLRRLLPDVKLLFMSGYTDPSLTGDAGLHPTAHFLRKPVALGVLARKVREVLDEAHTSLTSNPSKDSLAHLGSRRGSGA